MPMSTTGRPSLYRKKLRTNRVTALLTREGGRRFRVLKRMLARDVGVKRPTDADAIEFAIRTALRTLDSDDVAWQTSISELENAKPEK